MTAYPCKETKHPAHKFGERSEWIVDQIWLGKMIPQIKGRLEKLVKAKIIYPAGERVFFKDRFGEVRGMDYRLCEGIEQQLVDYYAELGRKPA